MGFTLFQCYKMGLVLCKCRGFPRDEEFPSSWGCATDVPATSEGWVGRCSGWSRRLPAALVCSSWRKLEEPWGHSGEHQGRFPRFLEQKTGSELPASMPGRADVELGTEPCEVKDPTDQTMGSHRSNAESGTAKTIDGGSGPGACGTAR